jgi:N-acetylmuramoyl-L-alanine amidase
MNPDPYSLILMAVAIWRESRGEVYAAKQGVAWVIQNRVNNPRWWGKTVNGVILMPFQFSSFNPGDPNAVKWPSPADPAWVDSLDVAEKVLTGILSDNTGGATSYYDNSITSPTWAIDGSNTATVSIGNLNFYKLSQGATT